METASQASAFEWAEAWMVLWEGIVGSVDVVGEFTKVTEVFNACFRACDNLNIGDTMGTFSYIVVPNLMACAQTRSCGQSRLK